MHPFGGVSTCLRKFWVVEENQLDSNMRSRLDLREDPQLMEKDPQPIPRIPKVVGSLQAYIRRHYDGEKDMEFIGIKIMIS
jgi:hypothetical protein